MIVKDESHIILETLNKLISKIKFDYYIICDTGSSDNTTEIIKNFFDTQGINGEIYNHIWKDFGHNRSLALDCAYRKADYLLIFDADDSIEGDFVLPEKLTSDSYMLKFGDSFNSYERMCLVKGTIKWKYIGVLHEYISADVPISKESIPGEYYIISGRTSSRNNNPNKYLHDAEILKKGYYEALENGDNISNRYVYYCANSYGDAGDKQQAIKWYILTLKSNGWFDERYNSCLRLYEYTNDLKYLVLSYHHNPRRVEGIYKLIQHYCCEGNYTIAYNYYNFIKEYYENEYIPGKDDLSTKLFAKNMDYSFFLPYYMIIICEKVKNYELGIKMYEVIINKMNNPGQWWINNLLINFQFFMKHTSDQSFFQKFKKYLVFLKNEGLTINHDYSCLKNKTLLIYTGFSAYLWNMTYAEENALGGSERAVLYLSNNFSKDYDIIISGDVLEETRENIKFIHRFNLQNIIKNTLFDCVIISRYVSFFTIYPEYKSKKTILMAHDIHFMNNLEGCKKNEYSIINENKIDYCVCLTKWQSSEYSRLYPNLCDKIILINNGINIDKFKSSFKIKNSFIYTSCSFRGLGILVDLWPKIIKALPDATLNICSYYPFPENSEDHEINDKINKYPNSIKHLGKLNPNSLYELMSTSEYWLYPCIFDETSCITAMEMLMSEIICLYYPRAGLTDTLGNYGIQIEHGNEIETLMGIPELKKQELRENGKIYAKSCSWKNRAIQWEIIMGENLNLPINVINLPRRSDRRESMKNKLIGINYSFFEGIDGKNLGSTKYIQKLFNNNDHGYNKGVIGYALSHMSLWKRLVNDPDNNYYIILEDDLEFCENFKEKLLESVKLFHDKNINIGFFSSFSMSNTEQHKLKFIKQENLIWTGGAHGYIITKQACVGLLDSIEKYGLQKAIDFEIVKHTSFDIYFLNQSLAKQESFEDSDIQRNTERFYFSTLLPRSLVFYLPNYFNENLLQDYFKSLETKYEVHVTKDLDTIKLVDELVIVHEITDESIFKMKCEINYLNTEPLNLMCRLSYVHGNVYKKYPQIKKFYDYCISNIKIMNENGILNTHYLEYQYDPLEVEYLKSLVTEKIYDFGIICSGFLRTKNIEDLTPPRRRKVVEHLIAQGFSVNIISGWGLDRDSELAKCKCILNIHGQYNDDSPCTIFEHIRCNRLLYSDYFVLSEKSEPLDSSFFYKNLKFIDYSIFFKLSKKSLLIDAFIFYNELDLLEYRLDILENVVDYFILVEATHTFMGQPKELYYKQNKQRFEKYSNKIVHIVVDNLPFKDSVDVSKDQQWENEKFQRNSISYGIKNLNLKDDDIIMISDVDEIPDPYTLSLIKMESNIDQPCQFAQDFYYYTLNNKMDHKWYFSKILKYSHYKSISSIYDFRLLSLYTIYQGGWHLSYFGSPSFIANKIKNFAHQEFNKPNFTSEQLIQNRLYNNIDIFDRSIKIENTPIHQNNYLPPINRLLNKFIKNKNYCFIHSCNLDDSKRLRSLLDLLLNTFSKTGVLEKIFINNIGPVIDNIPSNELIEINQYSSETHLFEIPTINLLRKFSMEHQDCNILYLHTKGNSHNNQRLEIEDWINMMLYFLVERYPVALYNLQDVDTVGCNYHTLESSTAPPHFSGNFWWAKCKYLATLPECENSKFEAEFWLHKNNPTFKSLHYTGGVNHYYNRYPENIYRTQTSKKLF